MLMLSLSFKSIFLCIFYPDLAGFKMLIQERQRDTERVRERETASLFLSPPLNFRLKNWCPSIERDLKIFLSEKNKICFNWEPR